MFLRRARPSYPREQSDPALHEVSSRVALACKDAGNAAFSKKDFAAAVGLYSAGLGLGGGVGPPQRSAIVGGSGDGAGDCRGASGENVCDAGDAGGGGGGGDGDGGAGPTPPFRPLPGRHVLLSNRSAALQGLGKWREALADADAALAAASAEARAEATAARAAEASSGEGAAGSTPLPPTTTPPAPLPSPLQPPRSGKLFAKAVLHAARCLAGLGKWADGVGRIDRALEGGGGGGGGDMEFEVSSGDRKTLGALRAELMTAMRQAEELAAEQGRQVEKAAAKAAARGSNPDSGSGAGAGAGVGSGGSEGTGTRRSSSGGGGSGGGDASLRVRELWSASAAAALSRMEDLKAGGGALYKAGRYPEAMAKFSEAISEAQRAAALDPARRGGASSGDGDDKNGGGSGDGDGGDGGDGDDEAAVAAARAGLASACAVLKGNRAACWVMVKEYGRAVGDCEQSLEVEAGAELIKVHTKTAHRC